MSMGLDSVLVYDNWVRSIPEFSMTRKAAADLQPGSSLHDLQIDRNLRKDWIQQQPEAPLSHTHP